MSNAFIITGTDTEVGKTYVTSCLVRELRRSGADAVGYKPVCCGERTDAELLVAASGDVEPIESLNPVWYQAPVAPAVAAELEGKPVSLREIREHAESMAARHDHLLLEGVGGWEVPMTENETFADLAGHPGRGQPPGRAEPHAPQRPGDRGARTGAHGGPPEPPH